MTLVIRVYGLMSAVGLVLWIFCIIDSISAREDTVRNLPKLAWIFIVFVFPLVGSIAWLVAGRPLTHERRVRPGERAQPQFPEYDRPGRAAAIDPEKDEEFLRQVRERAEEQRRAYQAKKAREEAAQEQVGQEQQNEDETGASDKA
jgi:hypothetical protein